MMLRNRLKMYRITEMQMFPTGNLRNLVGEVYFPTRRKRDSGEVEIAKLENYKNAIFGKVLYVFCEGRVNEC